MNSLSRKHNLNTWIRIDSELVAVDDASVYIWCKVLLIECKKYIIDKSILYQDRKSAIILEVNVKMRAGKKSQALNICYFLK